MLLNFLESQYQSMGCTDWSAPLHAIKLGILFLAMRPKYFDRNARANGVNPRGYKIRD